MPPFPTPTEILLILVLMRPASHGGPEELLHEACFTWAGPREELGQEVSSQTAALLRNPWRKEKAASVRPVLEIYSASGMPLATLLVRTLGLPWGWGLGAGQSLCIPRPSHEFPLLCSGRVGQWCPWAGQLKRSSSVCRKMV